MYSNKGSEMTKDEIIELARESQKESFVGDTGHWFKMEAKDLGRFYQSAFAAGAAHEIEKFCALLRQIHDSYSLQSSSKGLIKE